VFKRHFYTCFISDKVGVHNMDWFNEDMLCWESDFPHSDSNWPFAPEDVIATMGHLDDVVINKITHANAMAAYSFDPFRHIPQEDARAGQLRAQATDVDVVTHVGRQASQRDRDAWTRMTQFALQAQASAQVPVTAEASDISGRSARRATSLGN
jgi:hypothetical protein